MTTNKLRTDARIVLAIAWKDIAEGLRNKNVLGLVISALLVVVMYRFLPAIRAEQELPFVAIYDAGDTGLVPMLENSGIVEVRTYQSEESMQERLSSGDLPELGLTIPASFDTDLSAGRTPMLKAYVLHWVSDEDAQELVQAVEGAIAVVLDEAIPITIASERVYPTPKSGGIAVTAGMGIIYVVLMVGMMTTPQIMLEEKQTKTLDALLVSPATAGHVVLGKAAAGLAYAVLGGAISWAFFTPVVMHWWLAITTTLVWAIFAVAVGLILGTVLEIRQQLTLYAWVVIVPILLPMMLYLLENIMPKTAVDIARWVPSSVVLDLVRASAAQTLVVGDWLKLLAVSCGYAALAIAAEMWIMLRKSRG